MSLEIFSRVGFLAANLSDGGGIWDFRYLRRGRERPLLMYAHSLNVYEEDLLDEMSHASNNDFIRSVF